MFEIFIFLNVYNMIEHDWNCKNPNLDMLNSEDQNFKEIVSRNWTLVNTYPNNIWEFSGQQSIVTSTIGFRINEDGKVILFGRGINDVPIEENGCWSIEKKDKNIMIIINLPEHKYILEIIAYGNNTLRVKTL